MTPSAPMACSRPSALYQIGLALAGVAMVILPCIYVALTALAVYGVFYFATECFVPIWDWHVGHSKWAFLAKFICSVTPLLVGSAIAFFMVKPLFARRGARMQPLVLDPAVEPRVYGLVQEVCTAVGAPAPRRVELNCDLNASASFDRGLRGFLGNQLILTLGMPLVAGLTHRELAGVIAHEFGHFRQGAGMRFSYVIRRVNGWFARVVYERDAWDEAIASWSESEEGWITVMVRCAQLGVWFSRRVLWVLMMAGHAISCLLLRQMEYDADRAEIRLAGSTAFESTTMKMAALGDVLSTIHHEMGHVWRRQMQLPDNLPVLLEYRAARLAPEARAKVENEVIVSKTGLFDTHPSAADRVRRAAKLAEPGAEISDAPARELFENFDTLSRLVTLAHYEDDLNVPTSAEFLIPLEQLIRSKSESAPARAEAAAPPPPPAVRKLRYDPSAFQGRGTGGANGP